MSYKLVSFTLWNEVINLFEEKLHLTDEGLLKIVSIKNLFPKGITSELKSIFKFYPIKLPVYNPDLKILNYYWLSGFINTDGSFFFNIGKYITASITISQSINSYKLMKGLIDFLGKGNLSKPHLSKTRGRVLDINISKFNDVLYLTEQLKFTKLYGAKYLDFLDFCKGVELIKNKNHLSEEGKNKIIDLKKGMNQRRTKFEY